MGLNETGSLYGAALDLAIIGMAGVAVALATSFAYPPRARLRSFALLTAVVASALASGLLAALQPVTYRADNAALFQDHGAWAVAPSPQTSFWGSCSPGPSSGICASGWSDTWGPGLGWYLLVTAALVLMLVALLPLWRARRPHARATPIEGSDKDAESTGAPSHDAN